MTGPLTHAIEDYLKVIYHLQQEQPRASTKEIAKHLSVAPASVTGMLKRLAANDPPLVDYHRHHGVNLTNCGLMAALEVIRHHRLLEMYLHKQLGFTWDEVHTEAERLEHVISEELEERIAQALGDPLYDPHGEPIPRRDLSLPEQSVTRLSNLAPGRGAVIERIANPSPDLLRYLGDLGVLPGAQVETLKISPFDDTLKLQVLGQPESYVLGPKITRQIFVKQLLNDPPLNELGG